MQRGSSSVLYRSRLFPTTFVKHLRTLLLMEHLQATKYLSYKSKYHYDFRVHSLKLGNFIKWIPFSQIYSHPTWKICLQSHLHIYNSSFSSFNVHFLQLSCTFKKIRLQKLSPLRFGHD